ncbi:hypothetical protein RB595_000325 [Gaeumannomyces hyphopodioides]
MSEPGNPAERHPNQQHRHHTRVPNTTQVVPGAGVNIVLKADQPTGRTVSGAVRDVLTRGNHPRGIKVRLADGRVGRVQSMAPAAAAPPDSGGAGASGDGAPDAAGGPSWMVRSEGVQGGARRGLVRDTRLDEDDKPAEQIGLDAYIKQAKPKGRGKGKGKGGGAPVGPSAEGADDGGVEAASQSAAAASCPVCGAFEGDEAAVAHHVAGHFET